MLTKLDVSIFCPGYETNVGEEAQSANQPLFGRVEGAHGIRSSGGRRERQQTGEGGHPGADGATPA